MTQFQRATAQPAQAVATGPTINASHDQVCGWCSSAVSASEPITYSRESGWCHESCTTNASEATGSGPTPT